MSRLGSFPQSFEPYAERVPILDGGVAWCADQPSYLIPAEGIVWASWDVSRGRTYNLLLEPGMVYPVPAGREVTLRGYNEKPREVMLTCERRLYEVAGNTELMMQFSAGIVTAEEMLMREYELSIMSDAQPHLAHLLLRLNTQAINNVVHIKHTTLAALMHMGRESVSAVLGKLRGAGYIRTAYRRIQLRDVYGLQMLVG